VPTRSMFLRILWKLLGASRGRLTLALVALASGAAVCSALLNVNLDAEKKLTQEFRTLGANVVVIERESRVLARVASPPLAEFLHRHHTDAGVRIILNAMVKTNSHWNPQFAGTLT